MGLKNAYKSKNQINQGKEAKAEHKPKKQIWRKAG